MENHRDGRMQHGSVLILEAPGEMTLLLGKEGCVCYWSLLWGFQHGSSAWVL